MPNPEYAENESRDTQRKDTEIPAPSMELEEDPELEVDEEEEESQKDTNTTAGPEETEAAQTTAPAPSFERTTTLDSKNALTLENPTYPELVPADGREYRTNLEGLLSRSGKKKNSPRIQPVISAVEQLNAALDSNFTTSGEAGFNTIKEAYERVQTAADTYTNGRSPWTKAGKKRLQIIRGLSLFIKWESKSMASIWSPCMANVPSDAMQQYRCSDAYDLAAMQKMDRVYNAALLQRAKTELEKLGPSAKGDSYDELKDYSEQKRGIYHGIGTNLLGGTDTGRQISEILYAMATLHGDSAERSMERGMNLVDSTIEPAASATRNQRILEIENIFEDILLIDPMDQKFDSLEELENPKFKKTADISTMIFDLQPFIKEYRGWINEKNPGCGLTEEMFCEIEARHNAFADFGPWYALVAKTKDPRLKGLIDENLIRNPVMDTLYMKMNESRHRKDLDSGTRMALSDFYAHYLRLIVSEDVGPGKDPETNLEKSRSKYGGSRDIVEPALAAIRRHREQAGR